MSGYMMKSGVKITTRKDFYAANAAKTQEPKHSKSHSTPERKHNIVELPHGRVDTLGRMTEAQVVGKFHL